MPVLYEAMPAVGKSLRYLRAFEEKVRDRQDASRCAAFSSGCYVGTGFEHGIGRIPMRCIQRAIR